MEFAIRHDEVGTHIDWSLDGVTAEEIDWFWSNMEKGFVLWHPEQHEPLSWPVPPRHGNPLGAVHNAPQTWDDGRRQDLYIRFERLEEVPKALRACIRLSHAIIVAGLGFEQAAITTDTPLGYRLHQWQDHAGGVIGSSTAMGCARPETTEDGRIWAAHAAAEIGNWGHFLPDLFRLYRVVTDPRRNPFTDLSVAGSGNAARYIHIPD
ncbi:MAG: hypothetical protein KGL44_12985 [Sphingomonadales bacterium]|nr:hypothetical protein [Sphingomonadales bacterium]